MLLHGYHMPRMILVPIFRTVLGRRFGMCRFNYCSSFHHSCMNHDGSSKLLSGYLRSGEVENALKLFEEMPRRDVVTWSIMIHGLAKNGLNRKAVELFSCFRGLSFAPNSFTLVGVLVGIAGLHDLVLAQCVHGLVLKYGLVSNSIVATAMLDAYAKCASVFDSCKLFSQMECPTLVSSNALLAGMVHNELSEEAVRAFEGFRRSGLVPNSSTMVTLTQACIALESQLLCQSVHVLVTKMGLVSELPVNNSLLGMYSSLRDLVTAKKVFDEMECKDVICWTTMMELLIDLEHASEAVSVFCQMKNNSVKYDYVTLLSLLAACAKLEDLTKGKQVHAQTVVSGYGSEINVLNSIITMYAKCSDLDTSRALFDRATGRSAVSWSAIISGYVQNGQPEEAINLLIKFRTEEQCCFDLVALVSALKACSDLALLVLCQQLHCYGFKAGFSCYKSVLNSLISAYSKCGKVELACDVFRGMGDLQDMVSWSAILNGFGINGHGRTAVTLFHEMLKGQKTPDSATYASVLNACRHSGLVDDGLKIFETMVQENRVTPSQQLVGCIVDLLARAGCLSDVSRFISRFFNQMGPGSWRALLSGCLLHGNTEMAGIVAKRMLDQDPKNPDILVLLSNIFASCGKFEDAEELRSNIDKDRLMKSPGISLLNDIPRDYG